jgi:hypothetical protein
MRSDSNVSAKLTLKISTSILLFNHKLHAIKPVIHRQHLFSKYSRTYTPNTLFPLIISPRYIHMLLSFDCNSKPFRVRCLHFV